MTDAARHDRLRDLLPAHALGALDPEERREVEEHLAGCAECREELAGWGPTLEGLAESAPPVRPSAEVRAGLLSRIESRIEGSAGEAVAGERPRRAGLGPLAVAASVILALAAGLVAGIVATRTWTGGQMDARRTEIARLEERLAESRREVEGIRQRLTALTELTEILATAPAGREVLLAGLEAAPEGQGRLYFDPEAGRGVLVAGNLRPLPEDRVYQLWTLRDGVPRSAGIFRPGPGGSALHLLPEVPEEPPDAWAVTVEPAGGVPQPTGEMVLRG